MYVLDENGDGWVVDLFESEKKEKKVLKWLNQALSGMWIYGEVETYENDNDQVVKWWFLD
jgi:hypothetical protein